MDIVQILTGINLLFALCGAAGGFFAYKNAQKAKTIEIQHETIEALQQQVEAIKLKVESLESENTRLNLVIETIQSALQQRGILITINGELVTITDADGSTSTSTRKRAPARKKPTQGGK